MRFRQAGEWIVGKQTLMRLYSVWEERVALQGIGSRKGEMEADAGAF